MRVGIIGIAIHSEDNINKVNRIIGENNHIILGRMGIPLSEKALRLITLIVEGDTDIIGRMAGRIGIIEGVSIKSMIMKNS